MTCIAAIRDRDGNIFMGGDRCGSANDRTWIQVRSKVVLFNWMVAGATGAIAVVEELQSPIAGIPSPESPDQDPFDYLHGFLVPWLWRRGEKRMSNYTKDGNQLMDMSLLVGMKGRIFSIDVGGGVMETADSYFSIGAGRDWATGVLYACKELWAERGGDGLLIPHLARTALELSLKAAACYSPSVAGPFDILKLKGKP